MQKTLYSVLETSLVIDVGSSTDSSGLNNLILPVSKCILQGDTVSGFDKELDCLKYIEVLLHKNIGLCEVNLTFSGSKLSRRPRGQSSHSARSSTIENDEHTRMLLYRSQYYTNLLEHETHCLRVVESRIQSVLANDRSPVFPSPDIASPLLGEVLMSFKTMSNFAYKAIKFKRTAEEPDQYVASDVLRELLVEHPQSSSLHAVVEDCLSEWKKHVRFQEVRLRVLEECHDWLELEAAERRKNLLTSPCQTSQLAPLIRILEDPLGEVNQELQRVQKNFEISLKHSLQKKAHATVINALNITAAEFQRLGSVLCKKMPHLDTEVALQAIEEVFFPGVYVNIFHVIKTYVSHRDDIVLRNNARQFSFVSQTHMNIAEDFQSRATMPFFDAICVLRTMPLLVSPLRKIGTVQDASSLLHKEMIQNAIAYKPERSADAILLGGDDFVPAFIYCLLMADIPSLASELAFINCFLHPAVCTTEMGYYCTTLELAIEFIKDLSIDKLNFLPSPTSHVFIDGTQAPVDNLEETDLNASMVALERTLSHRTISNRSLSNMQAEDEVTVRNYILPQLKHFNFWSSNTEGLLKLVQPSTEVVGYDCYLVEEWVRNTQRPLKWVFLRSDKPDASARVMVISTSTLCSTAQQFFVDSVLWRPHDVGVESVVVSTTCGISGHLLTCHSIDNLFLANQSASVSAPMRCTTDQILSAANQRTNRSSGANPSQRSSGAIGLKLVPIRNGLEADKYVERIGFILSLQSFGFPMSSTGAQLWSALFGDQSCLFRESTPFDSVTDTAKIHIEYAFPKRSEAYESCAISIMHSAVTELQCMMTFLHYRLRDIPPTGYMDVTTVAEVRNFLKDVCGIPETPLLEALSRGRQTCRDIASELSSFGFACRFPMTLAEATRAVSSFQKSFKLHVDGYAGIETRKMIQMVKKHS